MLEEGGADAPSPRIGRNHDGEFGRAVGQQKRVRYPEGTLVFDCDESDHVRLRLDETAHVLRIEVVDEVEEAAVAIRIAGACEHAAIVIVVTRPNRPYLHHQCPLRPGITAAASI